MPDFRLSADTIFTAESMSDACDKLIGHLQRIKMELDPDSQFLPESAPPAINMLRGGMWLIPVDVLGDPMRQSENAGPDTPALIPTSPDGAPQS